MRFGAILGLRAILIIAAKEAEMMDVFMLALWAAFFALGFAYVKICDRL